MECLPDVGPVHVGGRVTGLGTEGSDGVVIGLDHRPLDRSQAHPLPDGVGDEHLLALCLNSVDVAGIVQIVRVNISISIQAL